jgi:digeranylgeranylglycerophospholipid reductase
MKTTYDALVIGGGPIGGYVAGRIAEQGITVALCEKKKEIGVPLSCAGLISPRVFENFPLPQQQFIQNTIIGAHIHSPSGSILTIGGTKTHAYAIDRVKFDQELIRYAEARGTEVFVNTKVISTQRDIKGVSVTTHDGSTLHCSLLIGADGPFSQTRDRFALPAPEEFLSGIGGEILDTSLKPGFVEIFLGKTIAPGFFAWIIPTNKKGTTARIGLCVKHSSPHSPKYYFSQLFKHQVTSSYVEKCTLSKKTGGVIPLGVLKNTCTDRVLLVGDAAAQVKPTSGGGIYTGLLCGAHCSTIAVNAVRQQKFSASFLQDYQRRWYADIGRELSLGMRLRRLVNQLSDKQLDKYIQKFQHPKIAEIISTHGDIDYPSKLIRPLLKKTPTLLSFLPGLLKK